VSYVHGYHERESERLHDQAGSLVELLHHDTIYPPGSRVLEAGCGVGAQTVTLVANSPEARFTCIDVSPESLAAAAAKVDGPEFLQADIFELPFEPDSFDHVFVCFVLEHLSQPVEALRAVQRVLKPGGTITVIEGDHGSAYFHPDSAAAHDAIQCLVTLQREGGDSEIGRRLYPVLCEAGFADVAVSPRLVYVDDSRPQLVDGFTRKTFTAMIEGVREPAIARGLLSAERFDEGIRDLYRTAEGGGTFLYTFFKATASRA
jgi:SAM-dependent methyltransferase